ncbi:MAG: DNA polymerase I [Clostridia bacterium]|nr:DNA polymerase I [Clostridia bacterium]
MKRIALIDGNSLINRAYYAMRNPMITKEGIYTHGIFGFINMMDKIIRDYGPEYMAIAFDLKAPTFRHEEYDEYKAGRRKMPPELAMEIPILKDILDAMNIRRVELEGYEADDIIGTLARMSEAEGLEPFVFTGDKDQLQLATDVTKIVYTKRGVSDFDIFDHDAFCEEYGFTPLQFIDYKGLAGDSSDNIPGIPGVGGKTATKLIQEFGSVEDIIAHVDDIKPAGLQTKVADNVQQAMMSKRLATIMTQVPLDLEVEDCRMKEPDYDRLIELYKKLEFNKFLSRLKVNRNGAEDAKATGETAEETSAAELFDRDSVKKVTVSTAQKLDAVHISGKTVMKAFGDGSHIAPPHIDCVAVLNDGTYYFLRDGAIESIGEWLGRELSSGESVQFAGHDLKETYYMLMCAFGLSGFHTAFDTAVAQYVLDSGRSSYSLPALTNEYLHTSLEEEKDVAAAGAQIDLFSDNLAVYFDYGFAWCAAVLDLETLQKAQIAAEKLETVLYEVELPLIEVMAEMEKEGFRTDRQFLADFGETLSGEIDKLAASIHEMAGEEFNINSTQQLGDILFEKLELKHGKKNKKGYSTSAEVLEKIKNDHPIIPAILEYRTLTKLKSTYVDGLIPLIHEDGKIHAHFQQTVTATGRISCTEPNLQNIPIRQELGRQLRKAFVPETEECILIGADYSQIELRVLAHMADDPALIEAFNKGEDIHRATAANVLGVPEDEITPAERSRAKAVNFGVIYGMSAFGLSGNLDISRKEAEDYINAYFEKHGQVRKFMDDAVAFAKAEGYVTTLLGRKRYIKEINAPNYMVRQIGERLAMNSPIQGSAADIIKIAMIKVYEAIRKAELKSKLILQIHDELVINTYPDEKEIVEKLLVENMETAYKLAVELKADVNEGKNWYELK